MKQFNKKQMEYLKNNFKVCEDESCIELESWTAGGVDMIITIFKADVDNRDYMQQLQYYYDNFDIDSVIDFYRQHMYYRRNFTVEQSLKDFTNYLKSIKNIITQLEKLA